MYSCMGHSLPAYLPQQAGRRPKIRQLHRDARAGGRQHAMRQLLRDRQNQTVSTSMASGFPRFRVVCSWNDAAEQWSGSYVKQQVMRCTLPHRQRTFIISLACGQVPSISSSVYAGCAASDPALAHSAHTALQPMQRRVWCAADVIWT